MKNKMWSVAIACGTVVALVAGCGQATSGNGTANSASTTKSSDSSDKTSALNLTTNVDSNATPQKGQIVFGLDDTYPPMEFTDNAGHLLGFDVDLGNALGNVLHEKVVWKPTAWDGIIPGLKANKYDAILSSMNVTPEREQQVQFVQYGNFGQVIVVAVNSTANIQSMADLKGKTVGVQIGTTSEDAVKKAGGANIKEYNTVPDSFQDLASGRLDAIVVDEAVGRYYMAKAPSQFKVVGQSFQTEPVGIAVQKSNTALEQQLQQALNTLKQNGTYDKLYEYWFDTKGQ